MKKIVLFLSILIMLNAFDFTFTQAFMEFNKGVKLEKTNPKAAQRHFKKAFELIKQLKNKDSSQVYYLLGRMYCNGWGVKKNYKLAEKYFLRALKLGNKRVHCCIARLYIREGKPELAKEHLKYALSHSEIANYCSDIDQQTLKEIK
ncbi:SEL1-like repeat protein [Caminibacter pacificus]|uniref:beta-lactamase n=1 Tax=Caminibacter pacificus TaxID=1424653 RepID=A0AAJ4RBW0_9BACT|nr:SEL1-like repeat protein [Caminibacter pacificus]QCI28769.1 sel1 repeat family protein [Caminibacter pacificus]ROR39357.1 Sel1 repeat-containing protein [Caminibacter pacificus]